MARTLSARVERFPVKGSFVIARGAKTHVDVAVAEVVDGGTTGRGEGTAIYYRGETAESVVAAILAQADAVAGGATRADLLGLMPAGAARNALDAALWDLEAKAERPPGLADARPARAETDADRLYHQPRRSGGHGGGGRGGEGPRAVEDQAGRRGRLAGRCRTLLQQCAGRRPMPG